MTIHQTFQPAQRLQFTRDGVYRSQEPMTLESIQRAAPAALAVEAHESRSDQYQPIPTMTVVEALRRAVGVEVYGATQANSRRHDKRGHTKHVLRLRRPAENDDMEAPELVLTNSYDGSTSYRLNLGVYRFVCANGLMAGETWDSARVVHKGEDAIPQMIEETKRLALQFENIRDNVADMRRITLDQDQAEAFAKAAITLRHDPETEIVQAGHILRARRAADRSPDLWTTFNRVQESMTRGGYHKVTIDERGRSKVQRVRAVKGIDGNAQLNKALWTLTEEMRKLAA